MRKISSDLYLPLGVKDLTRLVNQEVTIKGVIHNIREVGKLRFIIVRLGGSLVQCILETNKTDISPEIYREGNYVALSGTVVCESKAAHGFEIRIETMEVVSQPAEPMPFAVNKKKLAVSLPINLDHRPIALRHQKQAAIFRIQAAIALLFRQALQQAGFTEIFSPKIVFAGAEGGANVFALDYFGRKVYLAQSPQFYKQMMVGVFGRVFEVGPVFRAEPHDTARHLNEYVSMDLEMGPIAGFEDIMQTETYVLAEIFRGLVALCPEELSLLEVTVPQITEIPVITMAEALAIAGETHQCRECGDLDSESEKLVCQRVTEQTGSELVFVTHYPTLTRPVYAMEDPFDPNLTLSFDLLFRGLEITTGGQRIHEYEAQVEKMKRFGLDPAKYEEYLMIHRFGMPPHGGLGLGLERLTAQLLGLGSVKEASLFPRTMTRVTP